MLFFIFSFMAISPTFAACHVVTPNGSGSRTGTDWNNAYQGLPASLVRGDIYYLADGTYSPYNFTTSASGATAVEIRKAQTYDNCTGNGWNTSTMGNSQAVFSASNPSAFSVSAPYLVLNGNGKQTNPGCGGTPGSSYTDEPSKPSDCGIRIDASSCNGGSSNACNADAIALNNVSNVTLKYLEVVGNNDNNTEPGLIGYFGGDSNITSYHLFGRAAGCVYYIPVGDNQNTSFSYFWHTATSSSDTCHPQYSSNFGTASNDIEHDNVYRDINGSAVFSFTDPGAGNHTGMVWYNNVIWQTSGNPYTSTGLDDGVVGVLQGTITGAVFVQNTMINLSGFSNGWYIASPGQSGIVENNLWYNVSNLSLGNGNWTEDHNSFLGSGCPGSGKADVCISSSPPNPFVNWATGNFNLASENSAWNNRTPLGAPYTVDPNGTVRSTDRGAYQLGASNPPPPSKVPAPPTSLTAAPH